MRLPYSVLEHLSETDATDGELALIDRALDLLDSNAQIGEPIPFNLPDLKNVYIIWTEDRAWRIVFRRRKALILWWRPYIRILAIEREYD